MAGWQTTVPLRSPFMSCVTILQTGVFLYLKFSSDVTKNIPRLIHDDSLLTFHADMCHQLWRFLSYALLHCGWLHLLSNMIIQLVAGVMLEGVHGSTRVGPIYMAGILAGALSTCAFDRNGVLVGASGGGYALMLAHLADIILNYHTVPFKLPKMAAISIIVMADLATAMWQKYATANDHGSVSYLTHVAGATVGLTTGLILLREITAHRSYMRVVARTMALIACVSISVIMIVRSHRMNDSVKFKALDIRRQLTAQREITFAFPDT